MSRVDSDTKAVLRDLDAIKPLSKGDPDIAVVRRAYDEVFAAWTRLRSKKPMSVGYQIARSAPTEKR